MARRPWYQSPVFYILLVSVTTALFVFHGPILHGLEAWADRYFSQKSITHTLGWATDPEAGILELLLRVVLGIIAALFLLVFAVVVWVFFYGWKFYLLVPVAGGGVAWLLRFVIEPLIPSRRKKAEPETQKDSVARPALTSPETTGDTPEARRAKIEAWLSGRDQEMS